MTKTGLPNPFLLILFTLLGAFSAAAADQNSPPKAVPVKAAPVAAASPFSGLFVGVNGGMGFMNQQATFLTLPGEFAGSGKLYPTGGLLGITAGIGSTWGSAYAEAFVRADYAFTRASGSSPTDSFTVKNSLDLQQGVFIGVPLGTMTGALPTPPLTIPDPSKWPIPVSVPTNFSAASFILGPEAGIAERSIGVDVTNLSDGSGSSVNRWIYGPFVGFRVKKLVSQNVSLDLSYDHEFYRNSWTQSGGTALIGQFTATDTNTVRAGLSYHF